MLSVNNNGGNPEEGRYKKTKKNRVQPNSTNSEQCASKMESQKLCWLDGGGWGWGYRVGGGVELWFSFKMFLWHYLLKLIPKLKTVVCDTLYNVCLAFINHSLCYVQFCVSISLSDLHFQNLFVALVNSNCNGDNSEQCERKTSGGQNF